jgi:hypothetical protein
MKRLFACLLVAGVAAALLAPVSGQQPGQDKKDAPPKDKGDREPPKDRGPGDRGPPRFELGAVLPPFAVDQLDLTADQKKQLDALQKEVKAKLEKILTADQIKKLKTLRPRGPGGGPDRPPPDRPGRDRPEKDRPEKERPDRPPQGQ